MSKEYEVMLDIVMLETHYVEAENEDDAFEQARRLSDSVAAGGDAQIFQITEVNTNKDNKNNE